MKFEPVEIAVLEWLKNAYQETLITRGAETRKKLQDPEIASAMLRDYENEHLLSQAEISSKTQQEMEAYIKSESDKFYKTVAEDTGYDFSMISVVILMLKYEGYVEVLESNIGPEQCYLISPKGLTVLRKIEQ